MIKKSRGRFVKKNEDKTSERSKPRVQRMSEEDSVKFKSSRADNSSEDITENSSERSEQEEKSFSPSFKKERSFRSDEKRPDNVNLSISPRMLELAEAMAQETGMPLRVYLTELLKYALLAHGKRQGHRDKYLPEFTSQNKREVGTWRSASEDQAQTDSRKRSDFRARTRPAFGDRQSQDRRFDRPDRDKKFGGKRFGDKKFGDKKFGDKKFGDRKFGDWRSKDREDGDRSDNKTEGYKKPDYKKSNYKKPFSSSSTGTGFKKRWQSDDADKEGAPRGTSSRFGNKRSRFDSTDKSTSSGFGDKRRPSGFAGKRSSSAAGGDKGKFKSKSFQKPGIRSKFGGNKSK